MADKSLHDLFIDELRDAYDAEHQLIKALPKLARAAASPKLRAAFTGHLKETRGHVARLEKAFKILGLKSKGKHCAGIAGIVKEGGELMEEPLDNQAMDAGLIAGGQRAEHYEMAAYGSMIAWAHSMGHHEIAELLEKTLTEEKAADLKLTKLAEGGINDQAARVSLMGPAVAKAKGRKPSARRK